MKILGKGNFNLTDLLKEIHIGDDSKKGAGFLFHIFKIGKKFEEIPRGLCGHGKDKTFIYIDEDIEIDLSLHFENLTIISKGGKLIVRKGRVVFEKVLLEGVQIEAYNDSFVSFLGCKFRNKEFPIKGYDNATINIEGDETFKEISGGKVKLSGKAFITNAKDIMNSLKLDLISVLQSVSNEEKEGVYYFEVNEPIFIDEDIYIGSDAVSIVIKAKTLPLFVVKENAKLSLKNISIENNIGYNDEKAVFILNPSSHMEANNCTFNSHSTLISSVGAHVQIDKCEIKNSQRPAIKLSGSSFLNLTNSTISNCKSFLIAKSGSNINIENSKFHACTTPVITCEDNVNSAFKNLHIEGFKGDEYCIVITDSISTMEKLFLSSIRENVNGINVNKFSKVKISNSIIKDIHCCAIYVSESSFLEVYQCNITGNTRKSNSLAQVWIKSSRANIVNTKIERSPTGSGISISEKSAVYINSTKIQGNKEFGIFVDKTSALKAENLRTENNRKGIMSEIGSKLVIGEDCIIKDEMVEEIPLKFVNT